MSDVYMVRAEDLVPMGERARSEPNGSKRANWKAVQTYVDPATHEALREISYRKRMSIAELVEGWIKDAVSDAERSSRSA